MKHIFDRLQRGAAVRVCAAGHWHEGYYESAYQAVYAQPPDPRWCVWLSHDVRSDEEPTITVIEGSSITAVHFAGKHLRWGEE